MSESREYKRCPECAELVLAAARRCRYCGYRFDRSVGFSGNSLVDLLRRPKGAASLRELLEGWGTELAPEEGVGYFGYCRLDGRVGYLLVTTQRVAFFAGRGQERVIDWPRAGISATSQPRRLHGTQLRLQRPGGAAVTLGGFASRRSPGQVLAALADGP